MVGQIAQLSRWVFGVSRSPVISFFLVGLLDDDPRALGRVVRSSRQVSSATHAPDLTSRSVPIGLFPHP